MNKTDKTSKNKRRNWTSEEVEFLKTHYPEKGSKFVANALERNSTVVRTKAKQMNIRYNGPRILGGKEVKAWSPEEIEFLREHYPQKGQKFVADALQRNVTAVRLKASRQGIKYKGLRLYKGARGWTLREKRYLIKHYPHEGARAVAKALNRSVDAVRAKAMKHNVGRDNYRPWSKEEDDYIKALYRKKSVSEIAQILRRTYPAIVARANKIVGVHKRELTEWSEQDIEYVKEHFHSMKIKKIAKVLHKTESSVGHKARRMGLKKVFQHKWSKSDRRFLNEFYGKIPDAEIAKILERTVASVKAMAAACGLTTPKLRRFSKFEHEYIHKNYFTKSNQEIARILSRTVGTIEAYAAVHGLTGNPEKRKTGYEDLKRKRMIVE